jgi:nucleoside-diphosphate-sugar epimerase
MKTVLVTGANGFIGKPLCEQLSHTFKVHASVRTLRAAPQCSLVFPNASLEPNSNWHDQLKGVDVVIHLAARTQTHHDPAHNLEQEFHRVNSDGTLNLARQAAASGVRRFIFLSSIKVNGEVSPVGRPFNNDDPPAPQDPYGRSKWHAEQGLREISEQTGMEYVIIRPPLVYGPGIKGNFATMLQRVKHGMPLPFGTVTNNRRSLLALDNLLNLISICLEHPDAVNQTFLVSDGEDLSTADLLRRIGQTVERPARLFPAPAPLLKIGAALIGQPEIYQRLCCNLQVNIEKTRQILGWNPLIDVDEGLRRAVGGWEC